MDVTDPEDRKIITLARSARARTGAAQGACVRDTDGRTYAGASVDLPHLRLSAVEVAVAMAVSSGALRLEAVAVVGEQPPGDLAVVADLGPAPVFDVDPSGAVRQVLGG